MFYLCLISAALAGSTAGMGLSPLGGTFGGVTESGVVGLPTNPAAARTETPEIALDFGLSTWAIDAQLEDQAPVQGSGLVPLPTLGATLPLGDFGIGLVGTIPYGGGGSFTEEGAQRFHLQEGKVFLLEADLALAYQPIKALRVGVAGRIARGSMMKRYAVDSAGLLNSRLSGATAPEGEALLEGQQELDVSGIGYGYAIGISTFLKSGVEIHASYRSPLAVDLSGPAQLTPSNDIDLMLKGTAEATMVYPREVALGVVVPAGPVRLMVDGGWADWSTMERVDGTLNDVSVHSDDEAMMALLAATGVNESSLTDPQDIYNDLGNHPVFFGGAGVDIPLHARWTIRTGAWWAPTTIPEENFHLGIVDFDALDLRGGVSWMPSSDLTIAAGVDYYIIPDREIRKSGLSLTNNASTGRLLPSANGSYAMKGTRYGLTVTYRL
jgi:long-subunit fatty acid transport protein